MILELMDTFIETNRTLFTFLAILFSIIIWEVFFIYLTKTEKKRKSFSWIGYTFNQKSMAFMLTLIIWLCVFGFICIADLIIDYWRIILMTLGIFGGIAIFIMINYFIAKNNTKEETDEEYKKRKGYKFADGEIVRVKKGLKLGKCYGPADDCEYDENTKKLGGKIVTIKRHARNSDDTDFLIEEEVADKERFWLAEEMVEPVKKKRAKRK